AAIGPPVWQYLQIGEVIQGTPGQWVALPQEPSLDFHEEVRPRLYPFRHHEDEVLPLIAARYVVGGQVGSEPAARRPVHVASSSANWISAPIPSRTGRTPVTLMSNRMPLSRSSRIVSMASCQAPWPRKASCTVSSSVSRLTATRLRLCRPINPFSIISRNRRA